MSPSADASIAEAVEAVRADRAGPLDVDDRTIRLLDPVNGDPGFAVLRVLGVAQAASPVGAAARAPGRVAVGVWRSPELYVARWTNGKRWVVGYRLTGGARPNDYVRMEGRIPTRLETGNWYAAVPDDVEDAFVAAGVMLDDPPFPVPAPPPASPPPSPKPAAPGPRSPPRAAAKRAPKRFVPPLRDRVPSTRLCPSCRMHKAAAQFIAGSALCVDCR